MLVLPYGGSVLGLFASGSQENFYWTNSALNTTASARKFYAGDQWHNSGGDRTWLAPEADLFFPNFPNWTITFNSALSTPEDTKSRNASGAFSLVNRLKLILPG